MIDLNDVTKTHLRGDTQVHALRGVTGHIPTGSFTFLVGPSGSGKSTLLHLIGALDDMTAGEITVGSRKLSTLSNADRDEYRRSQVGFIFQNFNLLRNLDAVENVLVPFLPRGVTGDLRSRAVSLLERVGLKDRLAHRPSHLSGGEQQRVAIARALLKRPQLILGDEPTGELDTATGTEVFRYLREINAADQTTVVIVTHDPSHITPGDRVMRMKDGEFLEA